MLLPLYLAAIPFIVPQPSWKATGTLLEACSCNVPCPCNFGEPPTQGYCHTVYAYRLKKATYDGVVLDGLVFGGAEAQGKSVGYLDSRATSQQKPLLEKLALAVFGKGGAGSGKRNFAPVKIIAESGEQKFKVRFGDKGGFEASMLIGADGKSPIIVENNVTWPVKRFSKGKTGAFKYADGEGNSIDLEGVNANIGDFDLASSTSKSGAASCCTPKNGR